jgi:hypothetical protein
MTLHTTASRGAAQAQQGMTLQIILLYPYKFGMY